MPACPALQAKQTNKQTKNRRSPGRFVTVIRPAPTHSFQAIRGQVMRRLQLRGGESAPSPPSGKARDSDTGTEEADYNSG